MQIYIYSDAPEIEPELCYLCRLLSSQLQAEFRPVFGRKGDGDNGMGIVYAETNGGKVTHEPGVLQISRHSELWRKYLSQETIEASALTPLIMSLTKGRSDDEDSGLIPDDLLFVLLFLLSRYEEIFSTCDRDRHGRFLFANDTLYARGIEEPVVDLMIQSFAECLSRVFKTTVPMRHTRPVAVISHDIDIPFYYKKMVNEVSVRFKSLFRKNADFENGRFGKALLHAVGLGEDPYDTYAYFDQQERQRGIRSTYFLLMSEENRWGLDLGKYRRRFDMLARNGHEIALHPGYESFNDMDRTKIEKEKIQAITGCKPTGTRSHFLRFDFPVTYEVREKLGIVYDSSLGYAENPGFRGGICTPFRPFDPTRRREIDIIEIPMAVMDGTLRDYQGMSDDEGYKKILDIAENVCAMNGVLVFNWHNSFFLGESRSWQKVYERSMDKLNNMGFEFMTCYELAQKWKDSWESAARKISD